MVKNIYLNHNLWYNCGNKNLKATLNDFINGRGIYDVFMFEDVPVDTLEKIRLKYAFDELKDLGFEGGYERSEYVPTDVDTYDVPHNIDWSSYTNGDYVVVFKGNVAINRA